MVPDESLRCIADEIKNAQDSGRQIEPITSRVSAFDMRSAYHVSELIHGMRLGEGYIPVGRKIGFTNPEMWKIYGVCEPIWAYVYDRTVIHVRGPSVSCGISRFTEPKIEPEIVLHFSSTSPPAGGVDEIPGSIDWIAHGIEIVQSHFPGWRFNAADTVADWGLHGMLIVGEPLKIKCLGTELVRKLEDFSIVLARDGLIQEWGLGSNALGGPVQAAVHLLSVLDRQDKSMRLQAGELVTTGTLTPARSIRPGETWKTELRGIPLPGLTVTFEE